jgi:thioesterase domain-containing protein/acyl carrier protein
VVLDALPLTVNGKLDTRALRAPEYTDGDRYRAPGNAIEEVLAGIYARVLGLERVGVDDSFFELGGDSILAMRLIAAVNTAVDGRLPVRVLFDAPSVRGLSQRLHTNGSSVEIAPVETFQDGTGVPLFCIHPAGGISWPYQALGNYLDCPIIGIQQVPRGEEAEPGSVRGMAESYAVRLQALYPSGPYNILGWSFGGVVAHELAIELRRRGCAVQRLILLDAAPGADHTVRNDVLDEGQILEFILRFIRIDIPDESKPLTYQKAEHLIRQREQAMEIALPPTQVRQFLEFIGQNMAASVLHHAEHVPGVFDGDMVIFSAARGGGDSSLLQSWRSYVAGDITVYSVDCTHQEMMTAESLGLYGQQLKLSLEA